MNEDFLIKKGFVARKHKVLTSFFVFDVGRNRQIRVSSVHTPNEVVFISQTDHHTKQECLICVHNFDYDGYLTESKLDVILSLFI